MIGGLGITFGTQVGALLLGFDFRYVALAAACSYIILLILIQVWLPAVKVAEEGGAFRGLNLAFRDRYFLSYLSFSSGQQFMAAQFSITLPLVAVVVAGNASAVAWVYAVNSIVAVVLGYPIPRLAERHLGARVSLVVGVVTTAIGLIMIGLSRETISLLVAVFVYSVGIVLVRPIEQTVVAGLANPVALGSYFGVAALADGVRGRLGQLRRRRPL